MKRFLSLLTLLLSIAATATAGLNKDVVKATQAEFNTGYRTVRPTFLDHSVYTLKVAESDHACSVPPGLRRLAEAGEPFRIRKVHTRSDCFEVELETAGKTRLKLIAYDSGELSQEFLDAGLVRLLGDVFDFGPPPPPIQFVGNTESRLLHLDRCNHVPPVDLRAVFDDPAAGMAAGYRECPICFSTEENLPYPEYLAHRTAGLQDARSFELVYPPSDDTELQEKLDRLGAEVLAGWPLELSGFEYDFRVVVSGQPLAVSFRTGIVMVSDTMMRAADADEEILFVLAHEIAHCELHLPPRSPYAGTDYWSPMSKGYSVYWRWVRTQQLASDLLAIQWFQGRPAGGRDLSRARGALAKVQHAVGATDQLMTEPGQSVGLHERLWLFEPERFQPGDVRQVFEGYDGEGDVRFEVRLLGLQRDPGDDFTKVYLLLKTTDYQDKHDHGGGGATFGEIKDAAGRSLEIDAPPYIGVPGYSVLMVCSTRSGDDLEKFTPGPLQAAKFNYLDGVKKWQPTGADDGS